MSRSFETDSGVGVASFGAVAPYYDELMKAVPYRMWVGYYLLLLSRQDHHPNRILDVCCGTGTMAAMLADEGFDVTGIDLAPGMIEEAIRKNSRRRNPIRFEVMNATSFELNDRFDSAISFFDSLNNILDKDDLQSAFDRVAEHLIPGGSWIFDLNTAYAFEEQLFDQQQLRKNAKLRYLWEGDWDPSTRLITVSMRFWYKDEEFFETHVQRAYSRDEITEMLKKSGFEEIEVFHSYTLDPPRKTSDRWHFACIRA